ncbi:hypothetical protein QQ045_020379 [Rhodiola kirilowii]
MGLIMDSLCVLCKGARETRDHLFYDCQFAKEILRQDIQFLQVRMSPTSWHLLIPWFNMLNQKALRTRMLAAAVSMVAYEILRASNFQIFRGEHNRIYPAGHDNSGDNRKESEVGKVSLSFESDEISKYISEERHGSSNGLSEGNRQVPKGDVTADKGDAEDKTQS